LVWNDDAEAGSGERFDLLAPGIPEFREAVEEDNDVAVWWAGGDGVEFARAVAKGQVFESGRHKSRVYHSGRKAPDL
jgi:predicted RNA-binding protein with PUA domain